MAALFPHNDNSSSNISSSNGWKKGSLEDVTTIQDCFCPNCQQSHAAVTTLLPTTIPFFREVILLSLQCPLCHYRNSEVTFGGDIQERGCRLQLSVETPNDLERQLVKSDTACLSIPQLELEIPAGTQRGTVTTLEGFLKRAADNLESLQPERLKLGDLDNFYRCQSVIEKLRQFAGCVDNDDGNEEEEGDDQHTKSFIPFDVILDDPAGNSFIENFMAPQRDPQLTLVQYSRTPTQDMAIGLQPAPAARMAGNIDDDNPLHKNKANNGTLSRDRDVGLDTADNSSHANQLGEQQIMTFPGQCPNCQESCETNMCQIHIPHFKEVIVMNLLCNICGYRSTELKAGGAIPAKGTKLILTIQSEEDLKRELLLSDTAGIAIPEMELELQEGGMGGIYTTVEGLLKRVWQQLKDANPFANGDAAEQHHLNNNGDQFSSMTPMHLKYRKFLEKLQDISKARILPVTLIVDDPLSNSFIGSLAMLTPDDPPEGNNAPADDNTQCINDNGLIVEVYQRSWEQNESLGLNHINTDTEQSETSTN